MGSELLEIIAEQSGCSLIYGRQVYGGRIAAREKPNGHKPGGLGGFDLFR